MTDEHDWDDPVQGEQMMDDDALTPAEQISIASIDHLLADPTMWLEPRPDLQGSVIAAIRRAASAPAPAVFASTTERTNSASPRPLPPTPLPPTVRPPVQPSGALALPPPSPPQIGPIPIGEAPSARRRAWVRTAGAALAAAAIAVLVTTAVVRRDDGVTTSRGGNPPASTTRAASQDESPPPAAAFPAPDAAGPALVGQSFALEGSALAPSAAGTVAVSVVPAGTRLQIRLTGLADRRDGDFYQVWLADCAMTALIPAGSFHDLEDVVAWAGVDPDEFPRITVTAESAVAGDAAGQASSGQVYASGLIGTCPG